MSIIKGTNQIVAGFGGTKRSIGEVYFSQSSLATDNSGALPLFTGETIASANTIYPDFYNWVSSHPELVTTLNLYNQSIEQYGECPKYLIGDDTSNTVGWPFEKNKIIYTTNTNLTITIGSYNSSEGFSEAENYNLLYSNTSNISDSYVQVYIDEELTKPAYLKYVVTSGNTTTTTYRALFIKLFNSKITLYYNYNNAFSIVYDHTDTTVTAGVPLQLDIDSYISLSLEFGSIRLPKLSNYIKAANTSEGITQKEAGLPNITGDLRPNGESGNTWPLKTGGYSGAFSALIVSPTAASVTTTEQNKPVGIHFDASLSNPVYGKSDTVTPAHTTLYPWVVAYAAAVPASTAQAAEFQQGLSGKADTNLGNLSPAGKDIASGLGMPSSRYIDLELGANSTNYTPPANGWFSLFAKSNNTTGWYGFSTPRLTVRNGPTSNRECTFFVPVRKGENCSLWYSGLTLEKTSESYLYFRFFYAEGAE